MADTKISALTAATVPLAGTEVLPIVQSGTTKKVAVSDLTAGRAVASAGGTFTDNLVQGVAAKGVNFTANTPAAGMSTQLLSWFEEGSWTPVTRTAGGTYTVQTGRYVRVGKLVTCFAYVAWSAHTGVGSPLEIEGLPFQSSATGLYPPGIINGTLTLNVNESFNSYILTNVSYFKILRHNNITGADAGYTIPAVAGITLQFSYIAA
jgi:hypothetical protein